MSNDGYKPYHQAADDIIGDDEAICISSFVDEIEEGDFVDFGPYGQKYVFALFKRNQIRYAFVTDKREQRFNSGSNGWPIRLDLAEAVVERGRFAAEGDNKLLEEANEELAERAHDLWRERERAKGNADNEHMIPYDELPEEDKEKDRDYSRSFIDLLDEKGLEIVRKEGE